MDAGRLAANHRAAGSGLVVALGLLAFAVAVFALEKIVGWDATWRALGVTPLQPPFFDMHVINDYAACAAKGVDAYRQRACNIDNFNIPPTWLWLGSLGIEGADSTWMSILMIAGAGIVIVLLFRGGPWFNGIVGLAAALSPSVMMGVERGNLDLLILILVGASALIYNERRSAPFVVALGLLGLGVVLKLLPLFCVALIGRFSRKALIFASLLAAAGGVYLIVTFRYIALIRENVPTTFILSYGYKSIFLGIDHTRDEAGLGPLHLVDTWLPSLWTAFVIICAAIVAARSVFSRRASHPIDQGVAGTAFLFGAGIYCGTYLLGTNFIYRLMFLLLCIPQLLNWLAPNSERTSWVPQAGMLALTLGVLWLNGNANGHSSFLFLPQLFNWLLFFFLTAILAQTLFRSFLLQRQQLNATQSPAASRSEL